MCDWYSCNQQNRVNIIKLSDLYSLLRFLRISPWCHLKVWKTFVSDPFESKNNSVLETLRIIFETLMLRRTKDMNDSQGQKIVEIPPKYVEIKYLNFSDREKEIYDLWYSNSKAQVQDLEASGKIDYIHVFSIILRLRQVCIHHRLPSTTPTAEIKILSDKDFDSDILERLQDTRECPICFENMEQVSVLKCNHFICVSCVEDIVDRRVQVGEETIECPICREVCNHEDVARVERCSEKGILKPSVVESSKFKALMAELLRLRVECPDEKVIVFSQFSKALDMLETEFNNEGIGFSRYDGSMNVKQRERQLESFRNTNPVLLASLRSTGVGLNLVEACKFETD